VPNLFTKLTSVTLSFELSPSAPFVDKFLKKVSVLFNPSRVPRIGPIDGSFKPLVSRQNIPVSLGGLPLSIFETMLCFKGSPSVSINRLYIPGEAEKSNGSNIKSSTGVDPPPGPVLSNK